jgi:uncharacterized protein Usg
MASLSDVRFTDAWRALQGLNAEAGWSTFPIRSTAPSLLLAGRHQPGNQESLIVGFRNTPLPKAHALAQCKGFGLTGAKINVQGARYSCLILTRQASASVELFATIVSDLIDVLERSGDKEQEQLGALLGRIAAWQSFMSREEDGVLKAEAELGLIGELQFLRLLLAAGVSADIAIESWKGPYDSLHDFVFSHGEVEVKASARFGPFSACIASLDQLDESVVHPLYLATVQFTAAAGGARLPEIVTALIIDFALSGEALQLFGKGLLAAGYHDHLADRYHRQFAYLMTNLFEIGPSFPRLSKGNVPRGVVSAVYQIQVDATTLPSRTLTEILPLLGTE